MTNTKLIAGLVLVVVACKDENPQLVDAKPIDAPNTTATYVQIEQLARPGINEVFLFTNDFNNGYNATAPSFAGAPAAAVTAITNEAKTVMKALYLGSCLLSGGLGLSPTTGLQPAGIQCNEVGGLLWTDSSPPARTSLNGVTLTAASMAAAQAYADKVFSQFIPDVMRIDTSGPSAYLTLCGDANTVPLLCGGRNLNDDVIDITYNYLLAGAMVTQGPYSQVRALVSDGVNFSTNNALNAGNVIDSTGITNPNAYHPAVSATFPYSAAPF
jgi:hypothetical protein